MSSLDVAGTWVGRFTYQRGKLLCALPLPIPFTMIVSPMLSDRFEGFVDDDATVGVPARATVRGRLKGLKLTFVKRYPTRYVLVDGRPTSFGDCAQSNTAIKMGVQSHPPEAPPIHYKGEFDPWTEEVKGKWRIGMQLFWIGSSGRRQLLFSLGVSGTWSMKRIDQ